MEIVFPLWLNSKGEWSTRGHDAATFDHLAEMAREGDWEEEPQLCKVRINVTSPQPPKINAVLTERGGS